MSLMDEHAPLVGEVVKNTNTNNVRDLNMVSLARYMHHNVGVYNQDGRHASSSYADPHPAPQSDQVVYTTREQYMNPPRNADERYQHTATANPNAKSIGKTVQTQHERITTQQHKTVATNIPYRRGFRYAGSWIDRLGQRRHMFKRKRKPPQRAYNPKLNDQLKAQFRAMTGYRDPRIKPPKGGKKRSRRAFARPKQDSRAFVYDQIKKAVQPTIDHDRVQSKRNVLADREASAYQLRRQIILPETTEDVFTGKQTRINSIKKSTHKARIIAPKVRGNTEHGRLTQLPNNLLAPKTTSITKAPNVQWTMLTKNIGTRLNTQLSSRRQLSGIQWKIQSNQHSIEESQLNRQAPGHQLTHLRQTNTSAPVELAPVEGSLSTRLDPTQSRQNLRGPGWIKESLDGNPDIQYAPGDTPRLNLQQTASGVSSVLQNVGVNTGPTRVSSSVLSGRIAQSGWRSRGAQPLNNEVPVETQTRVSVSNARQPVANTSSKIIQQNAGAPSDALQRVGATPKIRWVRAGNFNVSANTIKAI